MRAILSVAIMASLGLSSPAPPPRGSPTGVEDLLAAAARHFDAREFEAAIAAFQAAYAKTPDPNFLYNIGRVYEESGQLEDAVAYYREFVRQPSLSLELRRQALERIHVLKAVIDETQSHDDPAPSPDDVDPTPPSLVPPAPVAPQSPTLRETHTPVPAEHGQDSVRQLRMQWAGLSLLGLAVAAGGATAVTGSLALRESRKLGRVDEPTERPEIRARGRALAGAADGLMAAAAVVGITGLTLALVGWTRRSRSAAPSLRASLTGGPGEVGIAIRGVF